jgi:hypothetical protein
MNDLARFSQLATLLEQEDPNPIVMPITRTGRIYEGGFYVCGDNGGGCGKRFTDLASKDRHQQWCRNVSPRESHRHPSMSRLMGG